MAFYAIACVKNIKNYNCLQHPIEEQYPFGHLLDMLPTQTLSHDPTYTRTSATRKTAKQLVRLLFPDEIRENLVFIWHRNFCNLVDSTDKGKPKMESDSSEETQKKPSHEDLIAIKSLAKVWASYPIWNATNTLLLDDSPEKCPIKYRKNALHPVQISGTTTNIEGGAYFDNDEENEKNQRSFFELLANNWSESSSSEFLPSFLKDNAKEYNMGWCMSSP
eukprot:scaffold6564_cov179-Skeletonema_marinoi.AAC.13